MRVRELNRIFNRDNVVRLIFIDVVDHAGQRRTLSRSGGSGHQKQPARAPTQILTDAWQTEFVHRQQITGNQSQHHGYMPLLLEDRDAEPGSLTKRKTEVGTTNFLQLILPTIWGNTLHQRNGVLRLENFGLHLAQAPIEAQHGGLSHRDMQIARSLLHHGLQ